MTDLIDRLGEENAPTGAGIVVGMGEVANSQGNYAPDPDHEQFAGKNFQPMSGSTQGSNHATLVGIRFFGLTSSIAPQITDIFLYTATGWVGEDFLLGGEGPQTPPLAPPEDVKIFNHSWMGTFFSNTLDNDVLRRTDLVALEDDLLIVAGVHNEPEHLPLLSSMYNGITVGRTDGNHAFGSTLGGGLDGPGRMKPEIVAPQTQTSLAAPVVAAGSALMVETARTDPAVMDNPLAERSDLIKAVLLAGAVRDEAWTNNPFTSGPSRGLTFTPLDEVFGAGVLNVNRSHMILTGAQQAGSPAVPETSAAAAGWDVQSVEGGGSRYWRFDLAGELDEAAFFITWHRLVNPEDLTQWAVANFRIALWRIDEDGQLQTLLGDDGLEWFIAGNVESASGDDNLGLLHINGLAAGSYALEVRRTEGTPGEHVAAVAWLLPDAEIGTGTIPGDLDGDGVVNVDDLLILLAQWGPCADCNDCPADLNDDCVVNVDDLLILLANWGSTSD